MVQVINKVTKIIFCTQGERYGEPFQSKYYGCRVLSVNSQSAGKLHQQTLIRLAGGRRVAVNINVFTRQRRVDDFLA